MSDRVIKIYISERNSVGVVDHNGKNKCLLPIDDDDIIPIIKKTIEEAKFEDDN